MYKHTGKEEYHDIYPEFNSMHEGMIRHKERDGASGVLLSALLTTLAAATLVLGIGADRSSLTPELLSRTEEAAYVQVLSDKIGRAHV